MALNKPWCEQAGQVDTSLIVSYWIIICCWICITIIGVYGTYQLFVNNKSKRIFFKILYLLISICFFISAPGFAFGFQSGWQCWYGDNFYLWEGTYMVGANGYSLGMSLLYLFFWIRLLFVFNETSMRLPYSMNALFLILLIVQLTTTTVATFYFLSGWNANVREVAMGYWTMFTWTNILALSLVIIVFIKQLLSVIDGKVVDNMELNRVNSSVSVSTPIPTNDAKDKRYKIWKLIIRCMICASVALLTSILIAILSILRWKVPNWHSNLALRGTHIALHIVDEMINLICLTLQFPFSKGLYQRLCGNIDSIVSKRVMMVINVRNRQ